jgi:hypothetical protein
LLQIAVVGSATVNTGTFLVGFFDFIFTCSGTFGFDFSFFEFSTLSFLEHHDVLLRCQDRQSFVVSFLRRRDRRGVDCPEALRRLVPTQTGGWSKWGGQTQVPLQSE